MSIKEYRDMYDHVRISGERKSEILSEITGDGGMRQPEHKHSRLMMAAAIVAAALVVILPVGGYASRKLNAHFSYSVESQAKDRTAILHFYKKYGEIDVDVLKVAHHGSGYSSSVTFFQMVHPRIAMIGVGEHNLYGHPARIVIRRLEERKIKILRTDLDGSFSIITYLGEHLIYR